MRRIFVWVSVVMPTILAGCATVTTKPTNRDSSSQTQVSVSQAKKAPKQLPVVVLKRPKPTKVPKVVRKPRPQRQSVASTSVQRPKIATLGRLAPRIVGYPWGSRTPFNSDTYFTKNKRKPNGVAYVIWATWCKPCKAGIRDLTAQVKRLRDAGIQIVLVNYKQDPSAVHAWTLSQNLPSDFLVLMDEWGNQSTTLGLKKDDGAIKLPWTVVTNETGIVTRMFREKQANFTNEIINATRQ